MERDPTPRRKRRIRYGIVALGLILLVGLLVGIKYAQISRLMAFGAQAEEMGPQPEAVATTAVTKQSWESTLDAVGTISSVENVEIRNEVAGVVTEIGFESGDHVEEGALLLALDSDIERSALAAAKARRDLARSEMSRAQVLAGQGAAAPARVDEVRASFEVARREVASLEAQLEKKTLRAPFAGRVGIRDVAIGQYLDAGSRITVLDAVGEVFVDFSLPQEEMAQAQNGTPVRVSLRARRGETLDGRIVAVEPTVDPVTRNLGFRAHVPDPEQRLRPGMFVDVSIVLPEKQEVVAVPATAIVHAAYGDSVFVVEEKDPDSPGMNETPQGQKVYIAKQQFVRVGVARGDFVQIEKGLEPGQRVVTAGAFKLRNLAPVVLNDQAQPQPSLNPRPENR